jgi:hypothetical protein
MLFRPIRPGNGYDCADNFSSTRTLIYICNLNLNVLRGALQIQVNT